MERDFTRRRISVSYQNFFSLDVLLKELESFTLEDSHDASRNSPLLKSCWQMNNSRGTARRNFLIYKLQDQSLAGSFIYIGIKNRNHLVIRGSNTSVIIIWLLCNY
eukprot:m.1279 g.1279  ORF g.1279 m.1279 type:complete len:106 (+) comp6006_c0_seq1:514-831(+)